MPAASAHEQVDPRRLWSLCERRLRSWPVPPRWSFREWADEMRGEGLVAALLAIRAYRADSAVPLEAYARMRIMGQVLARYRKEWSYALKLAPIALFDAPQDEPWAERVVSIRDDLSWALRFLTDVDRRLIERLFWHEETEAQVARTMGLSQQAVSKKKILICRKLRYLISETRD